MVSWFVFSGIICVLMAPLTGFGSPVFSSWSQTVSEIMKITKTEIINKLMPHIYNENYDIAIAMSSFCARVNLLTNLYCQAPSQIPNPQGPAPTQSNPIKISFKGTGADTKILWATHPTPPPTFKHKGGL